MTNYPLSSARISGLIDYFTCEITKLKSWLTLCEQFGDRGVDHDLLNIMYRHSCGFVSFSKCEHEKIYVEEVLKDFSLSLFSHWKKNFFSKFSHKIFVIILHDIIGLEKFYIAFSQSQSRITMWHLNCTAVRQSELINFRIYIIRWIKTIALFRLLCHNSLCVFYWKLTPQMQTYAV